jgi:regulator of sirC expression with transglutaminase-like and TPR domain
VNQHAEEAFQNIRKVHVTDKPHAFLHGLAAQAFERKGDPSSAIAELKTFLREEPVGTRADCVRKELTSLRASAH